MGYANYITLKHQAAPFTVRSYSGFSKREWNGTEDSHMTVLNCFDLLSLTTPIFEWGQPEQTRNTAYFHVIGNGGNRFCVSNAHCIEMHRALF